jgi:hypothetical protein
LNDNDSFFEVDAGFLQRCDFSLSHARVNGESIKDINYFVFGLCRQKKTPNLVFGAEISEVGGKKRNFGLTDFRASFEPIEVDS